VKPSNAVWITGVGTATPLGSTYGQFADELLAGHSGVGRVKTFEVQEHPSQIAGQVEHVPCPPGDDPEMFARLPRMEQLARWCCIEALRDSGWWGKRGEMRLGLVLGIGGEWMVRWEADATAGKRLMYESHEAIESLVAKLSRELGLRGPSVCVSAACASGNYALAQARHWLELGWVDVCLAGACDMAVTPMSLAAFGNLRALSRSNERPSEASRPFDKHRDGFVMSEGGAVFVLEKASSGRQRGARVYAEVAGFGASSDAHNMVIPSPDPEPAIDAMRQALADAQVSPDTIDYLNAHATSTPVGDVAETRVLQTVLGEAVTRTPISSTKSITGHLLTAAAAVEALACIVAMERAALPPTINLHDPDPECDLCHVANEAQARKVRVAVSNSFGFGGSNSCLVLKAV
jgi:3-oxoacyl-[acyl-carrier-protein] synthase II